MLDPAVWPVCSNCCSTREDATTSIASPTISLLRSTTSCRSSMPHSCWPSSRSRKVTRPLRRTVPNSPTLRFSGKKSSSATPRSETFCCCDRFAARSKPKATTPSPRSSSSTCSTSSSAMKSRAVRLKQRLTGGVMPSCSTSTPPAAAVSCRSRWKRPPLPEAMSNAAAPVCTLAGYRSHLALLHRHERRPLRAGGLHGRRAHGNILDGVGPIRIATLAKCALSASLRAVFRDAHRHRVLPQLDFRGCVRLYRGTQYARRSMDDRGARHPAVDPGSQLSAAGVAGDDCIGAASSARHRIGRHSADIHRAGVESRLQFLFFGEGHSARDDRSFAHLPLLGMAALLAAGNPICRHRPGLEFHRLGRERLVCADGLRDVPPERHELPATRTGQLHPDCDLLRRRSRPVQWHRSHRSDRGCNGSADLATADCVERKV